MSDRIGNWIGMPDGRRFYPLDPRADEVQIEDIAQSLANLCRFGGRCEPFYSVAQHSLHVMAIVERSLPHLALAALLHDAAEAYIGDIVAPLKEHVALWNARWGASEHVSAVESRIMRAINESFGVMPLSVQDRNIVKHADAVALATEARDLMGDPRWPGLVPPAEARIVPMDPPAAKRAFLAAFRRLTAKGARAS